MAKRILKFLALWLYHIPMNLWRCEFCGKRGCSPIDHPDGATEWFCYRCGENYWDACTRLKLAALAERTPESH